MNFWQWLDHGHGCGALIALLMVLMTISEVASYFSKRRNADDE